MEKAYLTKRDAWISSSIWYTFPMKFIFFLLRSRFCFPSLFLPFSCSIFGFHSSTRSRSPFFSVFVFVFVLVLTLIHIATPSAPSFAILCISIRLFCWICKLFTGMLFNMFLVLSLRLSFCCGHPHCFMCSKYSKRFSLMNVYFTLLFTFIISCRLLVFSMSTNYEMYSLFRGRFLIR